MEPQYLSLWNHVVNPADDVLAFAFDPTLPLQLSNTPLWLENSFHTARTPNNILLSKDCVRLLTSANAGGASELSEAFSYEVLHLLFGARLEKTEMEIEYMWPHWKKTDYVVQLGTNHWKLGVSVTRAMKHGGVFTKRDGVTLLHKKLHGVVESTRGVVERDQWVRQVLHIWATDHYIASVLKAAYVELLIAEPELIGNTVVLVTVAEGVDWIFYQDKLQDVGQQGQIEDNVKKKREEEKRKRREERYKREMDAEVEKEMMKRLFASLPHVFFGGSSA